MKVMISVAMWVMLCAKGFSQTQELEQLKLDLEKLAQFKLMLSEMKSGYQTLVTGYNSVRDASKANFNLHQNYLDGLLAVSPQLKKDPAIQRMYQSQAAVSADARALLARLRSSGVFTGAELDEAADECRGIGEIIQADMHLLVTVLTPGKLRMTDGERADVVAQLDGTVQQQLGKLQSLSASFNKLLALRLQGKRDMQAFKKLSNGQ
ncbi:MAG: hypothetical protein JO301_04105 [Chitinophagaceae bacterium]|nr:hypothetical protein [Chitinophagaceae bacterium]